MVGLVRSVAWRRRDEPEANSLTTSAAAVGELVLGAFDGAVVARLSVTLLMYTGVVVPLAHAAFITTLVAPLGFR